MTEMVCILCGEVVGENHGQSEKHQKVVNEIHRAKVGSELNVLFWRFSFGDKELQEALAKVWKEEGDELISSAVTEVEHVFIKKLADRLPDDKTTVEEFFDAKDNEVRILFDEALREGVEKIFQTITDGLKSLRPKRFTPN